MWKTIMKTTEICYILTLHVKFMEQLYSIWEMFSHLALS